MIKDRILCKIQHYNPGKYWKYRESVICQRNKSFFRKAIDLWRLLYIKKCDAFNNASMGTDLGRGVKFLTPPILPHGLNGIVISYYAHFGKGVVIFQQVGVAQGNKPGQGPNYWR